MVSWPEARADVCSFPENQVHFAFALASWAFEVEKNSLQPRWGETTLPAPLRTEMAALEGRAARARGLLTVAARPELLRLVDPSAAGGCAASSSSSVPSSSTVPSGLWTAEQYLWLVGGRAAVAPFAVATLAFP